MTTTEDRMIEHLRRALAEPDETVVLASLNGKGDMIRQTRLGRMEELVDLAQSLLSEVRDHWEMQDDLTQDQEDRLECVTDALACLPDPLADEEVIRHGDA